MDSIMGNGKTSAAIAYMNANPDKLFLFVTPYLSEVDRIVNGVNTQEMQSIINEPDEEPEVTEEDENFNDNTDDTKKKEPKNVLLRRLLMNKDERCSVAITHSLFDVISNPRDTNKGENSFRSLLSDYTLIIDETPNCVEPIDYYIKDRKTVIKEEYITIDENTGVISWNSDKYGNGVFSGMKRLINNNRIVQTTQNRTPWVKELDPDMLNCFSDCCVLTYLFYGSTFYKYLLKNKERFALVDDKPFELYHVENGMFSKGYKPASAEDKQKYKELITVCREYKWNCVGDKPSDLSANWYKGRSIEQREEVLKKAKQFFRHPQTPMHKTDETPVVIMWTCFKKYLVGVKMPDGMGRKPKILMDENGRKYNDVSRVSFVPCNMRASNEYAGRTHIAFLINVFMQPIVKNYLSAGDIEECYALSFMLQWLWRSAIRNNKQIEVFIPSKRMRELFDTWLSEDDTELLSESVREALNQ